MQSKRTLLVALAAIFLWIWRNAPSYYNYIMHRISDFYVCLQGIGSRRSVPVERLGGRLLEGCRSPSCLAAEKWDVLRQFSAGRSAIFEIIDRPYRYRSLVDLIRAMPVKRVGVPELRGVPLTYSCPAAEEIASFFFFFYRGPRPHF